MIWDSSTSLAASSSGVRAISSRYMPTRSRSAISPPTTRTLRAPSLVSPEADLRRATARVAMRAPLRWWACGSVRTLWAHPPGCPASEGNNDWNPDRIPNPPLDFSDHAVPCPATEGDQMTTERTEVQVRPGSEGDLDALTAIYNHYVRETPITFDTAVFTAEERRSWLLSHPEDGPHRLMVATDVDSQATLGYATSSPHRPKPAYATTVEVTIYLAPEAAGRGIGTRLYEALFEALE